MDSSWRSRTRPVSKCEGAVVALADVPPGPARAGAPPHRPRQAGQERDPRAIQVVLDESVQVVRADRGVLVCRTRHGFRLRQRPESTLPTPPDADTADPAAARNPRRARRGACARDLLRELTGASGRRARQPTSFRPAPGAMVSSTVAIRPSPACRPLDDWRGAQRLPPACACARPLAGRRRRRRRRRRARARQGLARAGGRDQWPAALP